MNQTKRKTRLGKRLNAIFNCIPQDTELLHDLCCDHGALGRAFLESYESRAVQFNDIHPDIMARLNKLLISFQAKNYTLNIGPAENVTLDRERKQTVILAGVGDEQCIEILKSLFDQEGAQLAHFIISPATKTHFVRRFLNQRNVILKKESCVTENNRTYEIIQVESTDQTTPSPVTEFGNCWETGNASHVSHIQKLIQFYEAQLLRRENQSVESIVHNYKNILKKISSKG